MAVTINGKGQKKSSIYDEHLSDTPAYKATKVTGKVAVTKHKTVGDDHGNTKEVVTPVMQKDEVLHKGLLVAAKNRCEVTVLGGATLNLGDMEFAKISVSVMVPCDKPEMNETYEFATDWVSTKLNEAIAKIKG